MASHLRDALVSAYAPHVRERTGDESAGMDEAIASGQAWLEKALDDLLALPFADQRRGPLEIFQEAMSVPTDYLLSQDLPPVARDAATVAALPGDLYDLAPASTRDLGDEVWAAHLAWGTAKAHAMRPSAGGKG